MRWKPSKQRRRRVAREEVSTMGGGRKPKVYIHPREYSRLWAFVHGAKDSPRDSAKEISGMGIVEPWDQDFYISKVYIVKQDCSGGHTDFDEEDVDQVMRDLIKEGRGDELPKHRLWWHSHAGMNVFFSGIDVATIDMLAKNLTWCLAACLNTKGDYVMELDYVLPTGQQVTVADLEFEPWYFLSDQEREEVAADIKRQVTFNRPAPLATTMGGAVSYRMDPYIAKVPSRDAAGDPRVWSSLVQGWVRHWQLTALEVAWTAGWRPEMEGTLYEFLKSRNIDWPVPKRRYGEAILHLHVTDTSQLQHAHTGGDYAHPGPGEYKDALWFLDSQGLAAFREDHEAVAKAAKEAKDEEKKAQVAARKALKEAAKEAKKAKDETDVEVGSHLEQTLAVLEAQTELSEAKLEGLGFGLWRGIDNGRLYVSDRSLLPYVARARQRNEDDRKLDSVPDTCCVRDDRQADYFGSKFCCHDGAGHPHPDSTSGTEHEPLDEFLGTITALGVRQQSPYWVAQPELVVEKERALIIYIRDFLLTMDPLISDDFEILEFGVAEVEDLQAIANGELTLPEYAKRFDPDQVRAEVRS